jgi:hypothetical protein
VEAQLNHFCIGLRDFNGDTALSTLKQQSVDAQKAANGFIEFRDLDRIKVELVPENYRNLGARGRQNFWSDRPTAPAHRTTPASPPAAEQRLE